MTEKGSYFVANATLVAIKNLISQSEWTSAKELMSILKHEGKQLVTKYFYLECLKFELSAMTFARSTLARPTLSRQIKVKHNHVQSRAENIIMSGF